MTFGEGGFHISIKDVPVTFLVREFWLLYPHLQDFFLNIFPHS
ncbi:unnamed protein product, partial [marine sediment metagenome]